MIVIIESIKNTKAVKTSIVIMLIIIIIIGVYMLFGFKIIDMSSINKGVAVFKYANIDVEEIVLETDLKVITEILNKKISIKDGLSCGFDENVSIKLYDNNNNVQTMCFACDSCGVIYWKEADRYFSLNDKEKSTLYQILEKYGFYFPCI